MEFIDVLENIPKDKFRVTANKLLNECFMIKKNKDTVSEYHFIGTVLFRCLMYSDMNW